jgi:uncharacterized protein (DUF934 family)
MPLIKNDKLIEDSWVAANDDEPLPLAEAIIVSLERWQAARGELLSRNGRLGLRLKSDQSPVLVAEDLEHFDLIALEFPKFKDGRAYSYARLLRERYGYKGELRAVGEVLRDQLIFMHRCGFDARRRRRSASGISREPTAVLGSPICATGPAPSGAPVRLSDPHRGLR